MLDLIYPQKLSPGDTIALVAPSEPVEREEVAKTKEYIEKLGYKLKLGKKLFYKIGDYTAGTAEDRAEDLNSAFADPEVKAILMGEGGYSADQVLDLIDYEKVRQNPKIFVGFSDATILELSFLSKAGLVTFHGPNGATLFGSPEYTQKNLWKVLSGDSIDKLEQFSKWEVLRSGKGKGLLIGGNLETICSTMGTRYDPFPLLGDQKLILFWEELETIYNRIIRSLFQLRNAGIFERCEGMVVGKITDCSEEGGYVGVPELRHLLLQMARAYDFPILWDVNLGHEPANLTIPQGAMGELETKTMTFKFQNILK